MNGEFKVSDRQSGFSAFVETVAVNTCVLVQLVEVGGCDGRRREPVDFEPKVVELYSHSVQAASAAPSEEGARRIFNEAGGRRGEASQKNGE